MTRALALDGDRLADLAALQRPALARALALLNEGGCEARLVGGAVRDLLLGEPPGDFDLATSATPSQIMARARAAGIRYAPTGVAHGTVTLILEGTTIEATTLREDVETDGRRAKVRFGRDFAADAARRDFTLNALSIDSRGRVHDYVGGLEDLAQGRVRFIGEARQRIREDFLRILRFLRFSARFAEGPLDAEGFAAAVAERDGLASLSAERVRAELLKIVVARRAAAAIAEAEEAGLIGRLIAGVAYIERFARVTAIDARPGSPDPLLRLAGLAVAVQEDAARLRDRLRLSNAEAERLAAAAVVRELWHGRAAPPSLSELRVRLFEDGREAAQDGLTLAQAEAGAAAADDPAWVGAWGYLSDTPPPRLPFSGADLVARGMPPGRALGAVLKDLQARWIRAGFPREPDRLAELMAQVLSAAD